MQQHVMKENILIVNRSITFSFLIVDQKHGDITKIPFERYHAVMPGTMIIFLLLINIM